MTRCRISIMNEVTALLKPCKAASSSPWQSHFNVVYLSSACKAECAEIKKHTTRVTRGRKSAERWKIAYQIEAIRLNCSHKYCFSHAYSICDDSQGLSDNCTNRDVNFFSPLPLQSARLCLRCSSRFLRQASLNGVEGGAVSTCGVPSKSAFPKCTCGIFAHVSGNNTERVEDGKKNVKSHHEWRFFATEKIVLGRPDEIRIFLSF